jgi:para-nitrobenzyl esterase
MLAMPAAKGLFHKAVIQSGPGLTMVAKDSAAKHAERTLAKLGVAPADVRKLLELDPRTIIAAATSSMGPGGRALSPVVDGRSLPRDPFEPDAPATARDVPLMIGTTKDESTLFLSPDPLFGTMTEEQARQKAVAMMGAKGAAGIDVFKRLRPNDAPTYWLTSLMTASGTWINSIRLAERKLAQPAPVYMFRMDWETPFHGGALKAPHGTEVPFVFDNPQTRPILLGTGPVQRKLGAVMSQAWIDFARSGNPSQPGLAWPQYDLASRRTMIFDRTSHVVSDPDRPARLLLS